MDDKTTEAPPAKVETLFAIRQAIHAARCEPSSRENSLVITKLEEAALWYVRGLTGALPTPPHLQTPD